MDMALDTSDTLNGQPGWMVYLFKGSEMIELLNGLLLTLPLILLLWACLKQAIELPSSLSL
ncbi:Protein of unknown function [Pyronema omphalodes CBS 100304]|uniref:Uncharacterized protein n=1 Tax=Pyronema omphalodes (strain CBS 100304) TaxID=1076935 RepID=U4LFU5_PYROM|nr:Protein of unknown function [Pyronema omphalodes CBS 100304]